MENLSDIEFGSDKSTEEAPILVAQRYLNIFRQVHIFNKQTRDQFDDELLALPTNITDFFKRLPGGRLLVEHIEDVKTERGISFVKSNRDDFSNGMNDESASSPANLPTTTQVVGGSLVVDSSFAETLAQSMASAFKDVSIASAAPSGGPVISTDFGRAFELIAEEIRTSRASLLDVLKETRNITDSVIASQVSISRILEGILSSKNKNETDTADLNNRIIASQASISKLLESLYTTNTERNTEISDYLNIDNKLQDFRNNITQTIASSLQGWTQQLLETVYNQNNAAATTTADIENKIMQFKSDITANVNQSLSEIRQLLFDSIKTTNMQVSSAQGQAIVQEVSPRSTQNQMQASSKPTTLSQISQSDNISDNIDLVNEEPRKKKKKKKKKNNEQGLMSGSLSADLSAMAAAAALQKQTIDSDVLSEDLDTDEENFEEQVSEQPAFPTNQTIDGVIRNSAYKHEDDFSNVHLDEPPLDIDDSETDDVFSADEKNTNDDLNDLDVDDSLDFSLPKQNVSAPETDEDFQTNDTPQKNNNSLDDFNIDDNLDFVLPEQGVSTVDTAEDFETSAAPQENTGGLDEFNIDDNLDFVLPEQSSPIEEDSHETVSVQTAPETDAVSLDDFNLDDNLDFVLPDDNTQVSKSDDVSVDETPQEDFGGLDDFDIDNNIDFEQSKQEASPEENTLADFNTDDTPQTDTTGLDDFNIGDSSQVGTTGLDDFNIDEVPVASTESLDDFSVADSTDVTSSEPVNIDTSDEDVDTQELSLSSDELDNLTIPDEIQPEVSPKPAETQSRYSAELDKIRAALTSDNIDISSLDEPIALDDYSDDENVKEEDDVPLRRQATSSNTDDAQSGSDEDWEYEYVEDDSAQADSDTQQASQAGEDWEWEYVDENGNVTPASSDTENSDEEWEWEYVEDDDNSNDENKPQ